MTKSQNLLRVGTVTFSIDVFILSVAFVTSFATSIEVQPPMKNNKKTNMNIALTTK